MLARVAATTGRPWTTAIARQLHFSEWTLYGVFVDDVIGAPANSFASDDPLCLGYWGDDSAEPGRRGRLPPWRSAHRRRCNDHGEISYPGGDPARSLC